jgi:hypothetical protein
VLHRWVRDDHGFIKCDDTTNTRPECIKSNQSNVAFLEFIWADLLRPLYPFDPSVDVYSENSTAQVRAAGVAVREREKERER